MFLNKFGSFINITFFLIAVTQCVKPRRLGCYQRVRVSEWFSCSNKVRKKKLQISLLSLFPFRSTPCATYFPLWVLIIYVSCAVFYCLMMMFLVNSLCFVLFYFIFLFSGTFFFLACLLGLFYLFILRLKKLVGFVFFFFLFPMLDLFVFNQFGLMSVCWIVNLVVACSCLCFFMLESLKDCLFSFDLLIGHLFSDLASDLTGFLIPFCVF